MSWKAVASLRGLSGGLQLERWSALGGQGILSKLLWGLFWKSLDALNYFGLLWMPRLGLFLGGFTFNLNSRMFSMFLPCSEVFSKALDLSGWAWAFQCHLPRFETRLLKPSMARGWAGMNGIEIEARQLGFTAFVLSSACSCILAEAQHGLEVV